MLSPGADQVTSGTREKPGWGARPKNIRRAKERRTIDFVGAYTKEQEQFRQEVRTWQEENS